MEKLQDVYVVIRKVYNRNNRTGILNLWETGISGVFVDAESASTFTAQVTDGIGYGDYRRSFDLITNTLETKPNFVFAYKQRENLTPLFVFECTREMLLP